MAVLTVFTSVMCVLAGENCAVNFNVLSPGSPWIQAKIDRNGDGPVYTDLTKTR